MNTIAKNIRTFRVAKNMTQEDLAAKIFTTRQTISNYETGKSKPDFETIGKLAEVLGVKAEELVYDMSDRKKKIKLWTMLFVAGVIFYVLRSAALSMYLPMLFSPSDAQLMQAILAVLRSAYVTVILPSFSIVIGWILLRLYEIYILKAELHIGRRRIVAIILIVMLVIWFVAAFVDLSTVFKAYMDTKKNEYGGQLMLSAYVESFYYRFIKMSIDMIRALNAVFAFVGGILAACVNSEKED